MRLVRLAATLLLASLALAAVAAASPSTSARTPAVLKHAPPAFLIGHSYSTNWSGYSSFSGSGTFADVKGSWTQPTDLHQQDDVLIVLGRARRLQLQLRRTARHRCRLLARQAGLLRLVG